MTLPDYTRPEPYLEALEACMERQAEANARREVERPILFADRLVRAILDGRKTQTRRPVKGRALEWLAPDVFTPAFVASPDNHLCPFGVPGDRLWVREAWRIADRDYDPGRVRVEYRTTPGVARDSADYTQAWSPWVEVGNDYAMRFRKNTDRSSARPRWRPSIHMPRWASRITLEVADVRVERVQDISIEDAAADGGFRALSKDGGRITKYGIPDADGLPGGIGWPWERWRQSPIDAFESLWDEHYAATPHAWAANPWVWVVSFRALYPESGR